MMKLPSLLVLLSGLLLPLGIQAERVDHFKGLPAHTLEEAVRHFSEYNRKLHEQLDRDTLTATDMAQIHELTYTLENALAKISEEFALLAGTLEALHVASERADHEGVRTHGRVYLETATTVVKP